MARTQLYNAFLGIICIGVIVAGLGSAFLYVSKKGELDGKIEKKARCVVVNCTALILYSVKFSHFSANRRRRNVTLEK